MTKKYYHSRRISGKLRVYRMVNTEINLANHLPETHPFNKETLKLMLARQSTVFVKPDIGSQGIGIWKVEKENERYKLTNTNQRHKKFHSLDELYSFMLTLKKKKWIIQQAILLETYEDRPYDVRVMVQRKPRGNWVCTGLLAKLGAKGKIVTNYYQGGKLFTIPNLYQQMGFSKEIIEARIQEMSQLALQIARHLSKQQAGMHEMGIDLAYDQTGKLWLIEVNSRMPEFYPVKHLDRNMCEKMLHFARSYGRIHG